MTSTPVSVQQTLLANYDTARDHQPALTPANYQTSAPHNQPLTQQHSGAFTLITIVTVTHRF